MTLLRKPLPLLLMTLLCSSICLADTPASITASLKRDYALSHVGSNGLKYDYNQILQPGTVLTVRIPGIYADIANTPQAIVGTVVANGTAQQRRGVLSALSSTAQGRGLQIGEPVYVTRIDVRQDSVHLEVLSAGNSLPRYRAEVNFVIPNLTSMLVGEIEQVIGTALSSEAKGANAPAPTGTADSPADAPQNSAGRPPSRPGVAAITAEQQAAIQTQLGRAPAALAQQVKEASSTLLPYLSLNSCINDFSGKSQLQTYLGPHGDINAVSAPYGSMRYHDKGSCLNVTRLQGWTALSLNAFQFQVVYTAADSGESAVRTHISQREPDGTWLMNY